MNLRQSITRNITFSEVEVTTDNNVINYVIYGETTPKKELVKWLKDNDEIPQIKVVTKTEKRAISIESFIKYSNIINNESEEN